MPSYNVLHATLENTHTHMFLSTHKQGPSPIRSQWPQSVTKSHWSLVGLQEARSLLLSLPLFIAKTYATQMLLFYLWHEILSCHQQAHCLSHMNSFQLSQSLSKSPEKQIVNWVSIKLIWSKMYQHPDVEWRIKRQKTCLSRIDFFFFAICPTILLRWLFLLYFLVFVWHE